MTTTQSASSAEQARDEPLEATALSVSLTVKDLQESIRWYRDIIGFAVEREIEHEGRLRAVALQSGNVRIMINQDDGAKGWDRVKGEGFSLHMTTRQDVDAIAAGIVARGGRLETEPADMHWGARVFRVLDPDGFKWSISTIPG